MYIIYQDKNLAVIDKPAGLIVHPANINDRQTTLVDLIKKEWVSIQKQKWLNNSRTGIVHRLDKDTSGVLIIAKNPKTLVFLQNQFKNRSVKKTYLALVLGKVEPKIGEIKTQIKRDKKSKSIKQKISTFNLSWQKSREAITQYKVVKYYKYLCHPEVNTTPEVKSLETSGVVLTLLKLQIKTGRTHQIRAHMKYKNWPIIGDMLYNTKESIKISKELDLNRQFLHSKELKIKLSNDKTKTFESELPNDLKKILYELKI